MAEKGYCSAVMEYNMTPTHFPPNNCWGNPTCAWYYQGRTEQDLRDSAQEMSAEIENLHSLTNCDCSNLITGGYSQGASIALLQQDQQFRGTDVKGTILLSGNPLGLDTQVTSSTINQSQDIPTINIIAEGDVSFLQHKCIWNSNDLYQNTANFLDHSPTSAPGPNIEYEQMFDKQVPVQKMVTGNRTSVVLQQGNRHNWPQLNNTTTNTRENIGTSRQCQSSVDCADGFSCVDYANGTKMCDPPNVCARYVLDHYLDEIDTLANFV
jgi:hypothetical protein